MIFFLLQTSSAFTHFLRCFVGFLTGGPQQRAPFLSLVFFSLVFFPQNLLAEGDWPRLQGKINAPAMVELSGIAASKLHPGQFWVLNDGGHEASLYLIASDGRQVGRINVDRPNIDWEALARFDWQGESWLAIGDLGNNRLKRKQVQIHLLKEPGVMAESKTVIPIEQSYSILFEGGPVDCEAMTIDSIHRKIYFASKEQNPNKLYVAPLTMTGGPTLQARSVSALTILDRDRREASLLAQIKQQHHRPTDMSLGPHGAVAVLSYNLLYYWAADKSKTVDQLLKTEALRIPLPPLHQAEAVSFDLTGELLFFTGEGQQPPLWSVKVAPTGR